MMRENKLGNNVKYKGKVHDVYTTQANKLNDGYDGLFPIAGIANGSGPWEWWADTNYLRAYLTGSGLFTQAEITEVNQNGYKANPFVSKARALRYIDSMVGYFAPRIAVTMGLQSAVNVNTQKLLAAVSLSPNPARDQITIENFALSSKLENIEITDLNGRVLKTVQTENQRTTINLNLPSGIYFARLQFDNTSAVKKFVVQ
jgi:hypothetical protein